MTKVEPSAFHPTRIAALCSLIAALLCPAHTVAAPHALDATQAKDLLDARFSPMFNDQEPGCSYGIARDGHLLASGASGLANMELGVPISSVTTFDIGSASKQFTATSIAILALRGALDLEADIRTYLPDMPYRDPAIRVKHLIYHSSGLPDVYEPLEWLSGSGDGNLYPSDLTLRMARGIRQLKFSPGSRFEYSNLGYLLLGEIVQAVSGQTLRDFAAANIFRPMGMSNTRFHDDIGELIPHRASAYSLRPDGKTWEWRHSDFTVMGDGGVYSTLADLARWYNIYKNPDALEGGSRLLELLLTPGDYAEAGPNYLGKPMNYAFGMQLIEWEGVSMIGHPGGWAGYATAPYYFPSANISVISLCNHRRLDVLETVIALGRQFARGEF